MPPDPERGAIPGADLTAVCVVVRHGHRVRVAGDVLPQPPHPTRDMVTVGVIAEAIQRADTAGGIGASLRSSEIGETHTVELLADDDGLLVVLHRRPTGP